MKWHEIMPVNLVILTDFSNSINFTDFLNAIQEAQILVPLNKLIYLICIKVSCPNRLGPAWNFLSEHGNTPVRYRWFEKAPESKEYKTVW